MNQLHIHGMWNDDVHTRQNNQDIKQVSSIHSDAFFHIPGNLLICFVIDFLILVVFASFYNVGDCSGDNF